MRGFGLRFRGPVLLADFSPVLRYLGRGSIAWLEMMTSKRPKRQIKEQYMKRLILAAGLFAGTLTASLQAQTMEMKATIPFEFQIGNTVLPAGEYSVRHSGGVLFVQQTAGAHKGCMFLTVGEDRPRTAKPESTLLFNRYDSTYYLSKVWTAESKEAQVAPKSPREKELASHIGQFGTTTVALRTK
jgi:hypothetical protein